MVLSRSVSECEVCHTLEGILIKSPTQHISVSNITVYETTLSFNFKVVKTKAKKDSQSEKQGHFCNFLEHVFQGFFRALFMFKPIELDMDVKQELNNPLSILLPEEAIFSIHIRLL